MIESKGILIYLLFFPFSHSFGSNSYLIQTTPPAPPHRVRIIFPPTNPVSYTSLNPYQGRKQSHNPPSPFWGGEGGDTDTRLSGRVLMGKQDAHILRGIQS